MNLFDEFDKVAWQDLQGNKYSKSLDSGMLLENGSPHIVKATLKGSRKGNAQAKVIIYDQDYVINWLIVKLIKPLSNYGLDTVTDLVKEAWKQSKLSTECLTSYSVEFDTEDE